VAGRGPCTATHSMLGFGVAHEYFQIGSPATHGRSLKPEHWQLLQSDTTITSENWIKQLGQTFPLCTMVVRCATGCVQVEPLMQTGHSSGAHRDPVWQLQWVDRGAEAEEVLVSVSTDGRVCLWSTSQASISHILGRREHHGQRVILHSCILQSSMHAVQHAASIKVLLLSCLQSAICSNC
jgi:hypothetical protein